MRCVIIIYRLFMNGVMLLNLGEFLKEKREKRKLSMAELSKLCGISSAQITRLENNQQIPKLTTILELARALNFSINELVENTDFGEKNTALQPEPVQSNMNFDSYSSDFTDRIAERVIEKLEKKNKIFYNDMFKSSPEDSLDDLSDDIKKDLKSIRFEKGIKVPLYRTAKCGEPSTYFNDTDEYTFIPSEMKGRVDFVYEAEGDSMEEYHIPSGSKVFIKKQPVANNGQIALICVHDIPDCPQMVLKKVKYINGIGTVFINGKGDIVKLGENIEIVGIVKHVEIDF